MVAKLKNNADLVEKMSKKFGVKEKVSIFASRFTKSGSLTILKDKYKQVPKLFIKIFENVNSERIKNCQESS